MEVTLWSKTAIYTTKELEEEVERRFKNEDETDFLMDIFSNEYIAEEETKKMWYALIGTEEEREKYIKEMRARIKEMISEQVFYDFEEMTIEIGEEDIKKI